MNDNCGAGTVKTLIEHINKISNKYGLTLHSECLDVGNLDEKYYNPLQEELADIPGQLSSILLTMQDLSSKLCTKIQSHRIFGNTNFNIIGMSQGALISRYLIQDCDLGQYKVHNFLSIGGPMMGVQKTPNCKDKT